MSMTPEVQESSFSNAGSYRVCNYIVYMTMIVATFDPRSTVIRCRLWRPIHFDIFDIPFFWEELLKQFLDNMSVPQAFLSDLDCDMIANLSKMLRDSIYQRCSTIEIDYFCVFVMVFPTCCSYNIVNSPNFFYAEDVPPRGFVLRMACEGGEHSLPAGAMTLERFRVQDEEDNCFICWDDFESGDHAARLPCSHVCHYYCILEWFVQRGTCPVCRFACSHAS